MFLTIVAEHIKHILFSVTFFPRKLCRLR